MTRQPSANTGRAASTGEARSRVLASRLAASAQHLVGTRYTTRGLRAFDTIGPSTGVAWYQLSYGSVVVSVDGWNEWSKFYPRLSEAEAAYHEEVRRLRSAA